MAIECISALTEPLTKARIARQSQLILNSTENQIGINVSVEVGKSKLDIVLHPLDLHFSIPNDQEHISKAIQVLKTHQVKRIVTEATGRYEHAFVFEADLPVVVVNPIQVRRSCWCRADES